MSKKIRKTIYIPHWVSEMLDAEGQVYDGPGVVVSAAIHHFCSLNAKQKIEIIQQFRSEEVRRAYGTHSPEAEAAAIVAAAEADAAKQRRKSRRSSSKAG